jgi:hypothetical protein
MAAFNSSVSAFKIGNTTINAVGTMAISASRPPLDTTPIGVLNTYIITGVLTVVASLDVFFSEADHGGLTDELMNPQGLTDVEVIFKSGDYLAGQATVVAWDCVSAGMDVVRGSFTLQFYGPVNVSGTASAITANETAHNNP